jgi:hypothetical protein
VADDRIYIAHDEAREGGQVYPAGLWAIGGLRAGHLFLASEHAGETGWPLAARDGRVALLRPRGVAIYDTSAPVARRLADVTLRGTGAASDVLIGDTRATVSLGEYGLQTFAY